MQRVRHRCLSMEFEDSFGVLNGKPNQWKVYYKINIYIYLWIRSWLLLLSVRLMHLWVNKNIIKRKYCLRLNTIWKFLTGSFVWCQSFFAWFPLPLFGNMLHIIHNNISLPLKNSIDILNINKILDRLYFIISPEKWKALSDRL